MSCFICGRGSCASWMHSEEEQEQYAPAIALFEKAADMRNAIREEIKEEEFEASPRYSGTRPNA